MSAKPKAIFFDAGGTLFRPFPSVGEIYAKAASLYGTTHDPERLEVEFQKAWKKRGGLSSLGVETSEGKELDWWHSLVREVFASQGTFSEKNVQFFPKSTRAKSAQCGVPRFDEFFKALHRSFEEKELWEIYPEVPGVLRELREKGFVLGIVSNWDLRLPKLLKNLGLDTQFDFLMSSSMCGATKPAEKIFREALKCARARPDEAVHVGDTYEEDYVGATQLGIAAYHLERNGSENQLVPMESKISSLADLLDRV